MKTKKPLCGAQPVMYTYPAWSFGGKHDKGYGEGRLCAANLNFANRVASEALLMLVTLHDPDLRDRLFVFQFPRDLEQAPSVHRPQWARQDLYLGPEARLQASLVSLKHS